MEKDIREKLKKYDLVIGIDEVGRGPIAGPVTVAAFGVQSKNHERARQVLDGITDSKKLTEKKRNIYADKIRELKKEGLVSLAIASVSAELIDRDGIIPALNAALKRALSKASEDHFVYVYLDGSLSAPDSYNQETIIKGDAKNWLIGAASVAAKVSRDTHMLSLSKKYPQYGFESHKGYGTKAHYLALEENGASVVHRKTWLKF